MTVVCCDLDGVVWRGDTPIPGSAGAVERLRSGGQRVAFLTNNSRGTIGEVVGKLERCGVPARATDVATSAQAAATLLARDLPSGARVHACAGPGVVEALEAAGFVAVLGGPCAAVVVGWHVEFDYDRLARAAAAVRSGARFVATNLDPTYPSEDGLLPGAGALTAAVATASGATAEVAGKPEAAMAELVRARFGDDGIMVGDRPSTDGAFAARLGWPFALVLSGVTGTSARSGGEPVPDPPPPYVADDLAALVDRLLVASA